MALYSYQAFNKAGKKTKGTVDAVSLAGAREQLVKMGLYPIKLELATSEEGFSLKNLFQRQVPFKDKILFTKQLSVLLKSGVPLLEAFELLIDQFEGRLKNILISIKDGLREGKSLAEGLGRYPKVFDTIYVQLVRAGEATGKLEVILDRLTEFLEKQEALRSKVKSALTYPIIQLSIISVIVVLMMVLVVPAMAQNFQRAGQRLPGSTQFLLDVSGFMRGYWWLVLLLLGAMVVGYRSWKKTPQGAKTIDRIKLKLPIIGFFARMGAIVQFSRTLGMLTEGGVNLAESLDIVCKIIDNKILASSLQEARENIIKQGKIAQYLKQTNIFPPIAIHLIKTGEESGKLDFMLQTVAQNYETELNEYADTLSTALTPIMMVIMAFIVGFIVIAIAQPLMEQTKVMGL